MKISSISTKSEYLKSGVFRNSLGRERECAKERINIEQNNYEQINTTIKRNSDGRVSFKGDPATYLHNIAHFVADKPLLAEAIFALFITCGARPMTIMATARTEEDKEKCTYQVAKSISSGIIGLAATALISNPISKANKYLEKTGFYKKIPEWVSNKFTEIINNSDKTEKIRERGQKVLNNYSKAAKNTMDKVFQPIFMPLRAKLTIMAVPFILNTIGIKKGSKKQAEPQQNINKSFYNNLFKDEKEKALFNAFSGVLSDENK